MYSLSEDQNTLTHYTLDGVNTYKAETEVSRGCVGCAFELTICPMVESAAGEFSAACTEWPRRDGRSIIWVLVV